MILSLIAAMDKNRLIGKDNNLPWHLPADLMHFKTVTMDKPILMGRKTYDSIGRPLPGRTNIVLTRSADVQIKGVIVVNSLDEAISAVADVEELMVIGGSSIYELLLPKAQRLYLSFVDGDFEGDAWFPKFDESEWEITETKMQAPDEKNAHACRFVTYTKK
ncbi:MAG: type 3 dihydrofolate reductase [Gammaproteobacteria bacterium]|nr:type 3 dihydrofolate reductase [Gammaproteobacteria bacterium]